MPHHDLAAVAAGIAALSAQLDALRLDVAVLGGRLDAVAARMERLAATPPPAPVLVAVPAGPSRAAAALRLPLVRAALAEPVPTEAAQEAGVPAQQVRESATGGSVRTPDVA